MPTRNKKRSRIEDEDEEGGWLVEESAGNQILPVAILPTDFDGVPLDGSQYLAVVRREARAAPSIARYNQFPSTSLTVENEDKPETSKFVPNDEDVLPPMEWRNLFLQKFKNMRESVRYQIHSVDQSSTTHDCLPKGNSAKKWFKYLHGTEPIVEEYPEEELETEKDDKHVRANYNMNQLRMPKDSLLKRFTTAHIMILLQNFTVWLNEDWSRPTQRDSNPSKRPAIEAFHSQWLFALLAHLDERLVGDDVSILRQLARSCLYRIAKSRLNRLPSETSVIDMEAEQGCWMIICVIAGVWGQYDLLEDACTMLRQQHKKDIKTGN